MTEAGSGDGERRQRGRTAIELKVEYTRFNTFLADYTKNISRGGTFIATERPLPIGTDFVFALVIPGLAEPMRLRGTVMWTIERDAATSANPAGMGIEFQWDDDRQRVAMERAVTDLVRDQLGPHMVDKLLR